MTGSRTTGTRKTWLSTVVHTVVHTKEEGELR
jgi:hypothetical protein